MRVSALASVPLPVPSPPAHHDGNLALFGGMLHHPGQPAEQIVEVFLIAAADHVADMVAQQ